MDSQVCPGANVELKKYMLHCSLIEIPGIPYHSAKEPTVPQDP